MKIGRLVRMPRQWGVSRAGLLMVCFFFAAGLAVGGVFHGAVTAGDDASLRSYILQFAGLSANGEDPIAALLSVLAVYLRYPVAAFLCGFTALGVVLIPLLCALQGCSLAFSVACFASALGRQGVVLAIAAFGLRCLVMLPVTLWLSVWAMGRAMRRLPQKRGRREKRAEGSSEPLLARLAGCAAVLLIGAAAELYFVPKLVALALAGI